MANIFHLPSTLRYAVITNSPFVTTFLRCASSTSTTRGASGRTYAYALRLLENLQSNHEVRSAISDTSGGMNLHAMPEMLAWTRKAGYDVQDFTKHGLKCIHVAGTKGKGSVCVMTENILLQYRAKAGKIGLYTSPHLVHVRERIRIDGSPISEHLFAKYFFDLWDRFSDAANFTSGIGTSSPDTKPGYFRYLTLLAFHTFIQEGVQTAIVECGIGGEYDSTNILPAEAVTVTGITRLGIDHAGMLGNTIEDIAWHKAGIMKKDVPVYSAKQVLEAQGVLDTRAKEKGTKLVIIDRLLPLQDENIKLGLDGDFQRDNASLAVILAASHLNTLGYSDGTLRPEYLVTPEAYLPEQVVKGLETATWAGRCQIIKDGNTEWFIDGAHTEESLKAAAVWFAGKASEASSSSTRPTATMLIFNQQDRDAIPLLTCLLTSLFKKTATPRRPPNAVFQLSSSAGNLMFGKRKFFTYAAFCTNQPFKSSENKKSLETQEALSKHYSRVDANQLYVVCESVEEAVNIAHKVSRGNVRVLVLVTGSLHLVGALLRVLEKKGVDITPRSQSAA